MAYVLIIAEEIDGRAKRASRELVGKARELAGSDGAVTAVLFGDHADAAAALGRAGADRVLLLVHEMFSAYTPEAFTNALAPIALRERPDIVLATASEFGRDLAARLAARLGAGIAAEGFDCSLGDEGLVVRRAVYGGNAIATAVVSGRPACAMLRPNCFPLPAEREAAATIERPAVDPGTPRARVVETLVEEAGLTDLAECDRIVAGGRALGGEKGVALLGELAAAIGAGVGASRAAVDAGWCSHDHQVGQSGITVNPALYIACGISGSIQHLAGMRSAKTVVAINTDPDAPIFGKCDYGIVGDLFTVVPAMTAAARRLLAE